MGSGVQVIVGGRLGCPSGPRLRGAAGAVLPGSAPDYAVGHRTALLHAAVCSAVRWVGILCQFGLFLCPACPRRVLFTAGVASAPTNEPLLSVAF